MREIPHPYVASMSTDQEAEVLAPRPKEKFLMKIDHSKQQKQSRTTREVLESHLKYRDTGNIDKDLQENFASDVVLFTNKGKFYGHEGIKYFKDLLVQETQTENYIYPLKLIDGPYAYIEWRTNNSANLVKDGADTFFIKNDQIVMQTIRYTILSNNYVLAPLDHSLQRNEFKANR